MPLPTEQIEICSAVSGFLPTFFGRRNAPAGIRNTTFLKKKSSMSQKNYYCMNKDVRIQSDRNLRGFPILYMPLPGFEPGFRPRKGRVLDH